MSHWESSLRFSAEHLRKSRFPIVLVEQTVAPRNLSVLGQSQEDSPVHAWGPALWSFMKERSSDVGGDSRAPQCVAGFVHVQAVLHEQFGARFSIFSKHWAEHIDVVESALGLGEVFN